MQKLNVFRVMEDIRNISDIEKHNIVISFANWRRKHVLLETDSAFF